MRSRRYRLPIGSNRWHCPSLRSVSGSFWQLEPESAAYHIPSALRLRGRLDVDALQRSFDSLVARHETLRTRFPAGGRAFVPAGTTCG
ncbi:condensation domain-containing protein [Pseudomonas aeruginosa]|nr:condensation domain-containing protein [Pseudomonas aeruginosa]